MSPLYFHQSTLSLLYRDPPMLLISLFSYHGCSQIALTEIPEGDLERLTKSAMQENIICSADDLFLLLFDQPLWWKKKCFWQIFPLEENNLSEKGGGKR